MKRIYTVLAAALTFASAVNGQELKSEAFDLLNLDRKGLEQVKIAHQSGDDQAAAAALLEYYRNRKDISTPEIQNVAKGKINKEQQKGADEALEHKFVAHKVYRPAYF